MPRIFISYRRAASSYQAGRLGDRLKEAFGQDNVFVDVDSIPVGETFESYILAEIDRCDVFLALLAQGTLDRINEPGDWVRREITFALNKPHLRVIPVLLDGFPMPPADALPDDLQPLRGRNAALLIYDVFDATTQNLIDRIEAADTTLSTTPIPPKSPPRWGIVGAIVLIMVFVAAGVIAVISNRNGSDLPTETPTDSIAAAATDEPQPAATGDVVVVPTETLTETTRPTDLPEPTLTPVDTATDAPAPTITPTPSDTATDAPAPTITQTPTEINIVALVETLDAEASAAARATNIAATTQAVIDATATATLWTDTPTPTLTFTPNITASIVAFLTERAATQAVIDATATATLWTDTPTPTFTPTVTPIPTITANDQWTVIAQDFDGVEMVLVPPGCFMMGSENGDADELPVHEVCFGEPFWIDRYKVTNAQFAAFNGQAASNSQWTEADRPRERITWFEARDFCVSREARLPTEAEWEYAARGPDSLIYPWGNDFAVDNVVYSGNSDGQTAPVGSRPDGVSWVGAYDLSGNVWEWVSTIYDQEQFPYPYRVDDGREDINRTGEHNRVLRGGSWYFNTNSLRAADRYGVTPDSSNDSFGFRCARS